LVNQRCDRWPVKAHKRLQFSLKSRAPARLTERPWTKLVGRITPLHAATLSAQIATATALDLDYNLPAGLFCHKFKDEMQRRFGAQRGLGARVTTP
jgi:hypothetical protein